VLRGLLGASSGRLVAAGAAAVVPDDQPLPEADQPRSADRRVNPNLDHGA
jgi:hypothetical protein